MTAIRDLAAENAAEIQGIVDALDEGAAEAVVSALLAAPTIFFHASGRSLLMLKAVAMRLMHTGLQVRVAGEVVTPAPASGDLVVVASARGGSSAVRAIETARAAGATVVAITATPGALGADHTLLLPARAGVATVQHAGSLFEQSLLVVGDAICRRIQLERGAQTADLDARHATL